MINICESVRFHGKYSIETVYHGYDYMSANISLMDGMTRFFSVGLSIVRKYLENHG